MAIRTNGAVLVGRIDDSYYFVESVFKYDDGFSGVTGCAGISINADCVREILSPHSSESYCFVFWEMKYGILPERSCTNCRGRLNVNGCEDCDYPSLSAFAAKVVEEDGIMAFIDNANDGVVAACREAAGGTEYVDIHSCGRIFSEMSLDDFDEVYNRKALVACLAYEDNAVDCDYAARVIFGK